MFDRLCVELHLIPRVDPVRDEAVGESGHVLRRLRGRTVEDLARFFAIEGHCHGLTEALVLVLRRIVPVEVDSGSGEQGSTKEPEALLLECLVSWEREAVRRVV